MICVTHSPISDKRAWQLSLYGVRLEQTQSKHRFTTSPNEEGATGKRCSECVPDTFVPSNVLKDGRNYKTPRGHKTLAFGLSQYKPKNRIAF